MTTKAVAADEWYWEGLRDKVLYSYGVDISDLIPKDELLVERSSRTKGRAKRFFLRDLHHGAKLLATVRDNGSLAITMDFAAILMSSEDFLKSAVWVDAESVEYVAAGRSIFAGHVSRVGPNVRPGLDVAALSPEGTLIAVGRCLLPPSLAYKRGAGVFVKIRDYLRRRRLVRTGSL